MAPRAVWQFRQLGAAALAEGNSMRAISLTIILLLHASAAFAQASFQFAVPGSNSPDESSVSGMRLSIIHGKNVSTNGLDLGFVAASETDRLSGASFVLGVGMVNESMDGGAQFSLVNVHTGRDRGLNAAFVNLVNDTQGAMTTGFVNIAEGATLFDLGGVNISASSEVQVGFINVTKEIKGIQFGFINIADNGFLPIFPFFNFPID